MLVCHFLKVATQDGTKLERCMVVVTTHFAQMVWLRHGLSHVGKQLQCGSYPLLQVVANLDRFQGLLDQVILASLVSPVLGIMTYVWRANTIANRAWCERHLVGRFTQWHVRPTPEAWIKTLTVVRREAGSATIMETLPLAGVLREAGSVRYNHWYNGQDIGFRGQR